MKLETYESLYWETFGECLKKYKHLTQRVETIARRVAADPLSPQSHLLDYKKGIDLQGKRSRRFANHFCIIYMVCDECIDKGFKEQGFNNCYFCTGEPLKRVIFLGFGIHDDVYSRHWRIV